MAPRLNDDLVEPVTRGGQPLHFGVDAGAFAHQALHHCRSCRPRIDAGQHLHHTVATDTCGEQLFDERNSFDRILVIDSLAAGGPTR